VPGETEPAPAPIAPASTVIVLRDGPEGPEVFLVRRHHAIAFMAGAHVFPGGRVDPEDAGADRTWCDGLDAVATPPDGLTPAEALAFRVAAARELFEEAGVLLARDQTGRFVPLGEPTGHRHGSGLRYDLHAHRRTLKDIITSQGWRLAVDAVIPCARWVTPAADVRRFDTWFFVARVPPGQSPIHDDLESTESLWMTPARAIAAARAGAIALPPPTWATLRELERFRTVADVVAWARHRVIRRREPRVLYEGGVRRIVLPGDPSLPEPDPVPFETRFVLAGGQWKPESDIIASRGGR
jgi:8-oxo-dGTP pyrophosphatase MutT (NUDIX family)